MKTFTEADLVSFGNYLLSDERKDLVLSNQSFSIEQARENLKGVSDADLANWGEGQKKVDEDMVVVEAIFIISERHNGRALPLIREYADYQSAESAISKMPPGLYQIEKIFVVS